MTDDHDDFARWWAGRLDALKHNHSDEVTAWQAGGSVGDCPALVKFDESHVELARLAWNAGRQTLLDDRDPKRD